MSYKVPNFRHPNLPRNELGYTSKDYEGAVSTLCAGCGHDSISAAIIDACFQMSIQPHRVAKLSGIGCSSKTPTYFLGNSHGFNSVHGRMPRSLPALIWLIAIYYILVCRAMAIPLRSEWVNLYTQCVVILIWCYLRK